MGDFMGRICEHELKRGIEYDLYARLNMTIAWHNRTREFVIKNIDDNQIINRSKKLNEIVDIANELEGNINTVVGCSPLCSKRRVTYDGENSIQGLNPILRRG